MAGEFSLNSGELQAALAILEREQAACLPTPLQARFYRAFNIAAYLLAAVAAAEIVIFTIAFAGEDDPSEALEPLHWAFMGLCAILFVLFVLNVGLIRKMYRHAQLRRRLRLTNFLMPVFRAEREASKIKNIVTICISVVGAVLTIVGLLSVVLVFTLWIEPGFLHLSDAQFAVALPMTLAFTSVGIGLMSFHFMRRGKQRLEIVTRLHAMLTSQAAAPGAVEAKLSSDDYDILASLERGQIISERAGSIITAQREAPSASYSCQISRQMNDVKKTLPAELLARVDDVTLGLLKNPEPADSKREPDTEGRLVGVPGTDLRILYDVDKSRHLVRLFELRGWNA